MTDLIRILIADDSPTARMMLRGIFEPHPDLRVIGEAMNGEEAVQLTESLDPDLVVMDVHMPVLNGIEASREIMARHATPIVIVSAVNQRDVDLSLEATQAGALVALPKPDGPHSPRFAEQCAQIVSMVRAMAAVKVVRHWAPRPRPNLRPARTTHEIRIVAIAASTGGPPALRGLLSRLPANFAAPIVLVQHIARDFTAGFAHWLDESALIRVVLAARGERLEPGTVYVAPDDMHLGVAADGQTRFSFDPPISGFRPSATYLFQSLAGSYGPHALAVIMTGMGNDGAEGLVALRKAGGYVIGQDETSSVVYGMAQEAHLRGAVDELLPLDSIADRMLGLVARDASDG